MKLPAYPRTKPSGVEWLGDVPEHWEVKRLSYLAVLKSGENITSEMIADGGDPLVSCAILTMPASGSLAEVHTRMPAVLPGEAHAAWLDPALKDGAKAAEFCQSTAAPIQELEHYPVSTTVNNARAEGEELISKIDLE